MFGNMRLAHTTWVFAAAVLIGGGSRAEAQSNLPAWAQGGTVVNTSKSTPTIGQYNSLGQSNSLGQYSTLGSMSGTGSSSGLAGLFNGLLSPDDEMAVMMAAMQQTESYIESEGMDGLDSWDMLFIFLSYYIENYLDAVDGTLNGGGVNGNANGTGTGTGSLMPLGGSTGSP